MFRIELKMKDATTSRLLWQGGGWGKAIFFREVEGRMLLCMMEMKTAIA
jgi:hypothetical protein